MPLHLSAQFAFDLDHASDALLQFEAAASAEQRILAADTSITSCSSINRITAQDGLGERIWIRGEGLVDVRYTATLEIERRLVSVERLSALPLHCLPGPAVQYLLDSRYCHSAQFIDFADANFAQFAGAGAKAVAIRDWVANHLVYVPGASDSATTATDTFHGGAGICRDYAHLFITLARACSIPARYVACFAPGVTPQDFHAVAQVYLAEEGDPASGAWQLVDPTGMADLEHAAIIGVGRDAGDVSFLTSFGPMRFVSSSVSVVHELAGLRPRNDNRPVSPNQRLA
jgi:transglutaminase-like putative cysteine protease